MGRERFAEVTRSRNTNMVVMFVQSGGYLRIRSLVLRGQTMSDDHLLPPEHGIGGNHFERDGAPPHLSALKRIKTEPVEKAKFGNQGGADVPDGTKT